MKHLLTPTRIALGSIIIGLLVLGLKLLAWKLTGSIALYSDALESTVNVATAIAAAIAVYYASQPADDNHPYGHHKAEYFSAVLEGVMIILAAVAIIKASWGHLAQPEAFDASPIGLGTNLLATAINGGWGYLLLKTGKRHRSPALVADAKHLFSDVYTSVGVLLGVGLAAFTGWMILDPLLAILVALNILWSGWEVIRHSVAGLMDEAADEETLATIRKITSSHSKNVLEIHDLRSRIAGKVTFVDFHLIVPGTLTVEEAHQICDDLETQITKALPHSHTTIHVEPEHEKQAFLSSEKKR